ncbi:MAG: CheR family methyltransferase, partial [Planctomycetota bacterium]
RVLHKAAKGVYAKSQVSRVPDQYHHFFQPANDQDLQVDSSLRDSVIFRRINLSESEWNVPHGIDVIFLRNVLLYFDRSMQEQILSRCVERLHPGGFLYVGACENIRDLNHGLTPIQPSIFQKPKTN